MRIPWFKKQKNSGKDIRVFLEVHQNGEILSKTSRPFEKSGKIYLSSNPDAELCAPYYPLPYNIKIATITKRGVELSLDPTWEGFTTCEGKIEDINSDRKSHYTHIMKRGDYGSIAHNDLRVLIRVGREREPKKHLPPKKFEYSPSLVELWLGSSRELKFLGVGCLAAAWLIGGFALGLKSHGDLSPKKFIELADDYTLPFVAGKHFEYGPEILQSEYNRNLPVQAALDFTQSFADTLTGQKAQGSLGRSDALFPASKSRYLELHAKREATLAEISTASIKQSEKYLADQRNAVLTIPTVKGEAFTETLLRMEDKLNIWYGAAAENRAMRDRIALIFQNDPGYDPKKWKDLSETKQSQPDSTMTNEEKARHLEVMYGVASNYANRADIERKAVAKRSVPNIKLEKEAAYAPRLAFQEAFASLSPVNSFEQINQKLGLIQASIFDPDKPKIVREPLIGTLDPKMIQQTVDKYRFELQLCYELALRRNQQISGSMEWQWHLDSTGEIYDIELLQSSIQDQQMIQCVKQKIASWSWPKPQKGSIQISFPFHFKPAKG